MVNCKDIQVVTQTRLERIISEIFIAHSLPRSQAVIGAEVIVKADLIGTTSHGVTRLMPFYIPMLKGGSINKNDKYTIKYENSNRCHIDANNGFGPYIGHNAMCKSIKYAKKTGAGIVSVVNSTHFGIASYYTMMASSKKLIGIVITNGSPAVVPPGGKKSLTGTNAISVSFPSINDFPIVIDIGMASVSLGNLFLAMNSGEMVPSYLGAFSLLKKQGILNEKNIDPSLIFNERMVTPLGTSDIKGGYKGFQILLMVDLILALIFNGKYSFEQLKGEASHLFITVDPLKFMDSSHYDNKIKLILSVLRNYETEDEFESLRIPGERAHNLMKKRMLEGIPVETRVMKELIEECNRLNIDNCIG